MVGFDKEVYCTTCCPKVGLAPDSTDTSKIKGNVTNFGHFITKMYKSKVGNTGFIFKGGENENDTCPVCKGKVFEAEKIKAKKFSFHKNCFKCLSCFMNLDTLSVHEDSDGAIFCKNCYIGKYFTGGRNFYLSHHQSSERKNSTTTSSSITVDPQACLNCGDKVYEVEKIQTKGGLFHLKCLQCFDCKKQLDTTNFLEARDKQIYCGGCYSVKYGVRSRASSCGPINFGRVKAADPGKACKACHGELYEMDDKLATSFGLFHRPCFRSVN